MNSVDLDVLKTAKDWANASMQIWLATVVETFGSSPRPAGAMLVLRADGVSVGSVSGGCIEDDLAELAKQGQLPVDQAKLLVYGVSREEAQRFGLPCGGTLRLLVEPINTGHWVSELLARIERHELVARTLDLHTLAVSFATANHDQALAYDQHRLTSIHGPQWRMLIIGAGQTSSYLARMAQALDYEIIVCDPREEFRRVWDVPDTCMMSQMPDDAVVALKLDHRSVVIALTHDPKLDDMALLEALKSPAFYVGALGSMANNIKRRERLALFDLEPEQIARLHGPIGLDIGSRTPPEIAIAILGHLIKLRFGSKAESKKAQHQKRGGNVPGDQAVSPQSVTVCAT